MFEKYVSKTALDCYLGLLAQAGTTFAVQTQLDEKVYGAVIAVVDFKLSDTRKRRFMILGQGEILVHTHKKRREHFFVRHLCEQTTLILTGIQGTPILRVGDERIAGPGDWHGFRVSGNGCAVIEVLVDDDDPKDLIRPGQEADETGMGEMVTCAANATEEGDPKPPGSTAWHPGD